MPEISIVIPTYNRCQLVSRTVRQVLEQNVRDFELWVVDQSDPEIKGEVEASIKALNDPRLHYLHLAVKGHPNARNEGIARVSAPIILFLDDDVILLVPDFLEAHIRAYDDASVGGVTGRIAERIICPNTRRTMCRISLGGRIISNLSGHKRTRLDTLKGANMSYRVEVFRNAGGFDRNFVGAFLEDAELSTRVRAAGWTLLFEPAAELFHLSSPSGGVRAKVKDPAQSLYWQVRSTTYFTLKHRGMLGLPFFLLTFGAMAVRRALTWQSPGLLGMVCRAVGDGFRAWQLGSDDAIPCKVMAHGTSSVPPIGAGLRHRTADG